MGFFSEDMLPMLGVYEAETSELMASLDEIVTRTEGKDLFASEDIAELFRCTHTIKGSSAMMGLDALSNLAHKVEDMFDLMRGDPTCAEGRVPDIIDRLYAFSDYVKDELARMGDDDFAPTDADGIIADIAAELAILSGGEGAADAGGGAAGQVVGDALDGASSDGASEVPEAPEESGSTLKVSFKPDVPMVNARALVIVKKLGGQVRVLSHEPHDLSDVEAAKAIADNGLLLVVHPDDVEQAKQILAKNSYVRRIAELDEAVSATASSKGGDEGKPQENAAVEQKFVKLRWSNIHDLQNMAGEFLLQASRLKAISASMPEETRLREAVSQTTRLVDDLVYRINKMAMVSMSAMIPQLSRMVRDMSRSTGKQVSFTVEGGDMEIDRNLYNSISEPLQHIIRNSVDHGIEMPEERLATGKEARGHVTLSIENLGTRVAFRVSDDGKGIDTESVLAKAQANGKLDKPAAEYSRSEVLMMVMLPGLSTTSEVTQYSGRGVGMDVVSTVVRDFNGHVDITSEPGQGTTMTLFMPLSVASVDSLGFRIGPSVYHMPLFNLSKIMTADEAAGLISHFEGSTLFLHEKRQIPVLDMHGLLGCSGEDAFYIVCQSMSEEFVIGVDDIIGELASANKPLPSCLDEKWQLDCPIRNVAILDDGTVGYALQTAILAALAHGHHDQSGWQASAAAELDAGGDSFDAAEATSIPASVFAFTLGDEQYAIPIDSVERLIAMPACAATPRAIPFLRGLSNFRNQALAVFDLAKSAGAEGDCPFALIVLNERGERTGMAISSAIGVLELENAVLTDDQPDPRQLAGGLRVTSQVRLDPKDPPITILTMRPR